MNAKEFARLVARDGGCLHCGETEAIAPNHRINRGMGGVGKNSPLNLPSNLVILCSQLNGLIESDDRWAAFAKRYGYKLERWQNPAEEPVFDFGSGVWKLLDESFGSSVVPEGMETT